MELRRPPTPLLLVLALGAPPLVCGALATARGSLSPINAVLVLVLVVVGVAAGGSRVAGVAAAASATAWFDFFWIEPYLRFTIADRDDVETAILLTVVGVAVTELVLWGRRQQSRASEREGYLTGVVRAASLVAAGGTPPAVVLGVIGRQILDVLGVDRCEYVDGPLSGSTPRVGRDGSMHRGGQRVDVDRSGLPTDDFIELPVETGGAVLGRFVLTASTRVVWTTLEQRLVAVTLAEQAAAVLTPPAPSPRGPSARVGG